MIRAMLSQCAQNYPRKAAYLCGARSVTWSELDARSSRLAAVLHEEGIVAGEAVGILALETIEVYEHLYACAKLGAVRVSLNWRFSAPELTHILHDARLRLLFVQAELLAQAQQIQEQLKSAGVRVIVFGTSAVVSPYEERMAGVTGRAEHMEWPELEPEHPLLYSYTSGTTGRPKGAIISNTAAAHAVLSGVIGRGFTHDDIYYVSAQSAWIVVMMTMFGLANGMTHAIPDGAFEIHACLRDIERLKVTAVLWVPTMIKRAIHASRDFSYDLSSLRVIMYGSSPASAELVRDAYATFGCELTQTYGMTETCGGVTHLSPADHRRAIAADETLLSSVGRPSTLFSLSLRSDEGVPVAPGEPGEIWIRGKPLMTGYLNLAEENAAVFDGDWFRTNDIGRIDDDGYLFLIGRRQFQINTGAVKVYPTAVEEVLSGHPSVAEVCVLGAQHPEWGEAVVALIEPAKADCSAADLLAYCATRMSKAACPKAFLLRSPLDRTATGKVDRRAASDWLSRNVHLLPWKLQPEDHL
nr:AMP-binding protein [Ramlibacter albus]